MEFTKDQPASSVRKDSLQIPPARQSALNQPRVKLLDQVERRRLRSQKDGQKRMVNQRRVNKERLKRIVFVKIVLLVTTHRRVPLRARRVILVNLHHRKVPRRA